jgi:hypothetical protein
MPEPIFIKLGMYIMASEPISTAYFINPPPISLCFFTCFPHIVARQRLGKKVTAATNTHATIELMDASFLCGPCCIKGK